MTTPIETTATAAQAFAPDMDEYREELKEAVAEYIERGFPVTVCRGKNPGHYTAMGDEWQKQRLTYDQACEIIDRVEFPAIGIMQGAAGGVIDFDIDGADELEAFVELFDGEPPILPTYTSGREGGEHRLAAYDARLNDIAKAVHPYKSPSGKQITVRLGCPKPDESGNLVQFASHSVVPPSLHVLGTDEQKQQAKKGPLRFSGKQYKWLPGFGFDDVDPPKLADDIVEKLERSAKPPRTRPLAGETADANGVRRDALDRMKSYKKADGEDGSNRLYYCGCKCVELDLTDAEAIATVRELEKEKPFPKDFTDSEVLERVRQAERKVERGSALDLTNCVEFLTGELDKKGNPEIGRSPLSMRQVKTAVTEATKGWPRRVGPTLFIDDPAHGVAWLEKPEATFGWLQTKRSVRWFNGTGYVSRSELQSELQRTAAAYDAVEDHLHFPKLAAHYYACPDVEPGKGDTLRKFLARFRPSTNVDRDLILAAIVTTFWGGPPGARPAFIFTSDAGRGAGKTKAVELITRPSGGFIDVSAGEDIGTLKSRLLSPEALQKRNCLLDNVKSMKFSWAELEAQITTPLISGRRLYVGEGSRPNVLTWFITLNGVSLSTDLAQRCVIIKLDRGENSGTWYEDSLRFIDQNRTKLIADIAGFMQGEKHPLATFSRWGSWENDVLSRLPEPSEAQALILERQGQCDSDQDEAELIEEFIAEQLGELQYNPRTCQVRIPNAVVADWYTRATNDRAKTPTIARKLRQMADERQLMRLSPDPSRAHGRGFIYTGPDADVHGEHIANDLKYRISNWGFNR